MGANRVISGQTNAVRRQPIRKIIFQSSRIVFNAPLDDALTWDNTWSAIPTGANRKFQNLDCLLLFQLRKFVFEDGTLNFDLNFPKRAWALAVVSTICLSGFLSFGSAAWAQDQGGGGQIGGGQFPDPGQQPPVAPAQGQNTNQSSSTSTSGGDGIIDPTTNNVDIELSENTRNQGFVGATAPGISTESDAGFVGAVSEQSGPDLVEDASFGGGVNNVAPVVPVLGANGEVNSFSVVRKSIRARLVPNFYAPATPGNQVSTRFQNRLSRQPGSQFSGSSYSVTVSDRTAYIRGSVNSTADSQRLERQLRLEPGVYQIVNELSVAQQ